MSDKTITIPDEIRQRPMYGVVIYLRDLIQKWGRKKPRFIHYNKQRGSYIFSYQSKDPAIVQVMLQELGTQGITLNLGTKNLELAIGRRDQCLVELALYGSMPTYR